MTVPGALLALLTLGPGYGHQLSAEFARRTGGVETINPGQTHATLRRLHRDGLVDVAPPGRDGRERYRLTATGRTAAADWLHCRGNSGTAPNRDDLAVRLALAASLPHVDIDEVITAVRQHRERERDAVESDDESPAERLLRDRRRTRLEGDLAWLEHARVLVREITASPLAAPPVRGRRRRAE